MEAHSSTAVRRLSTLGVARLGGGFASGWGVLVLLFALAGTIAMTYLASQGRDYGGYFIPLLIANGIAVLLLAVLIFYNALVFWRQWRAGILGTRLAMRLVLLVAVLTVTPAGVIFGFSWQFLNQGVDSWFNVEVRDALEQAMSVARSSIEQNRSTTLEAAQNIALALEDTGSNAMPIEMLMRMRSQHHLAEATLLDENGRIIASSSDFLSLAPRPVSPDMLTLARARYPYTLVEPDPNGKLVIKVLLTLNRANFAQPQRFLYVMNPLPQELTAAADSIQLAYQRYQRLELIRDPMKAAFNLSLTSVLLITILTSLWISLFLSRRLAAPIGHLAAGTRAVARGEFAPLLPVGGHDEMGILVHSFNSMTRQLAQAQRNAARARQQAEARRAFLETILGHLSSGVMTFDVQGHLTTANAAVNQLLGVTMERELGEPVDYLKRRHPEYAALFEWVEHRFARRDRYIQEELVVERGSGRQVLLLRAAALPQSAPTEDNERDEEHPGQGGFVLVFDDITTLLQAQRSAAWSEVARRLAHEIKNPLTPIQLSAERLRRKYLSQLGEAGEPLDRATRTIINQVESLKVMVDAFSEYARQPQLRLRPLDLNALILDVLELYREQNAREGGVRIVTDLDPTLPLVEADAGRLRQVLHNLVRNALDVLSPNQRLEIRTRASGGAEGALNVHLSVSDTGPGFPPEILERVFEPYVTTKPKGTGLGLAIVKKMVDEHGGQISASNRPEGGAQVLIVLPARVLNRGVA